MEPELETAEGAEGVIEVRSLGELLDSQEFMVTALIGAAVVLVDATRRFNQNAFAARPNDVLYAIAPRYLAISADYVNAYAVYVVLRLLSYALPALAILHIFSDRGMTQALGIALPDYFAAVITNTNFPLFWGAIIAGVLPSFSFVHDIEKSIRRFSHLAGAVPTGVKRLSQSLRVSTLRPSGNFDRARLLTDRFAFLHESDFDDEHDVIDHKWARVAYILDYFFDRHERVGTQSAFFDAYREELEREDTRFRSLQIRFAIRKIGYDRARELFGAEGAHNLPRTIAAHDPFLEQDIDYLLDRLEVYLACAIRNDEDSEERAVDRLREIGFAVPTTERRGAGAVGGVLATLGALVAAAFVGALTADPILIFTSEVLEVTEFPYEVVPGDTTFQRAANILIYTLTIVLSTLLGAFMVGAVLFKIPAQRVETGGFADKPLLNYVAASVFGALCGLIALTAIVVDTSRPLIGAYSWVLYWTPSFFVLGLLVHLYAYGPTVTLSRLLGQATVIGAGFGLSTYLSALWVFGEVAGFTGADLDGAALYFAINAFWAGLFSSAALIHMHRMQRDRATEADRAIAAHAAGRDAGVGDDSGGNDAAAAEVDAEPARA